MRTNLPVTQNEYVLKDDHLIVSTTDLKGRITFINKDFLEVSGFVESELIGEPHNLVRHPDMPTEAFEDMWRTLKEGRPWTGYVKNRCKNGDYYWVLANAAPIVEGGRVTGYISVRRKASREAIATYDAAYRLFREKRQGNLVIRYGKAVKKSAFDFKNVGIGPKIWTGIGVILTFAMIAVGSSWLGMQKSEQRFNSYLAQEQQLLDDYSEMYAQGLQMGQALRNIVLDPSNDKAYKNLTQARADFQEHMKEALAVPGVDSATRQGLDSIGALSSKHFGVQDKVIEAVKAGKQAEAQSLLNSEDTPLWRQYKGLLLDGRKALEQQAAQGQKEVQGVVSSASIISLVFGVLTLLVAAATAGLLGKMIRRPMEEMDETFANVLQGNYSNVIDITRNDEIGKALQGLQVLQTRMGFEMADTKRKADEMARIKVALDCVGTPVRIADPNGVVTYANKSLLDTLRRLEPELKKQNPKFSVDTFVGSCIGTLYADPDAALKRLAVLSSTVQTDMDIGGRSYRVVTSPVFTQSGERLGSAGEWRDRTDEIAVEKEITSIVSSALQGDLEVRISKEGKTGFFALLAEQMNDLLNTTHRALQGTSDVLSRVARGDLTQTVEQDYDGIFGQLKDDTNTTVERLREVVGRIKGATDAIETAAKEIAMGNQDLSSRTEEQASSLEETASSMEQLTSTVRQNAASAREANQLADKAQTVAVRGGDVVGQVVETMSAIHESSSKIADIIGVIDGIAFQTNILALNAAVEAARAGEQGRGFAVVASEVRNLAQRSAVAAKEIKELISSSVERVSVGNKLVDQAGQTMSEVVSSIQRVATIMADISHASHEQSQGIEQVGQAVGQMDEVTQQNAALVEQAAAAAESLEEQAHGLVQTVSMFKLNEQHISAAPRASSHVAPSHAPRKPAPAARAVPRAAAAKPASKASKPMRPVGDDAEHWEEF